jgi:hypothetical protein
MAQLYAFVCVLLVAGYPVGLAWSQSPLPVEDPVIQVVPKSHPLDTAPGWPASHSGVVTAISGKSITLTKPGYWGPRYVMQADGIVRDIGPVFTPPEPARTFEFSLLLKSGRYLPKQGSYSYTPKDVKEGDKVYIRFSRRAGRETCEAIQIRARPGGLVPPLPEEAEDTPKYRYHDYANAHNDLRDKGIPLPKKLVDAIGVCPTPASPPEQTKPKE